MTKQNDESNLTTEAATLLGIAIEKASGTELSSLIAVQAICHELAALRETLCTSLYAIEEELVTARRNG